MEAWRFAIRSSEVKRAGRRLAGVMSEMNDVIIVREWDIDEFHTRVRDLEETGYLARRDSYRIVAEMDPETGGITHLHTMEMRKEET